MITVNPCPFCRHVDVEIDQIEDSEFLVDCPECRATGPIYESVIDAVAAWNYATRQDKTEKTS